LKYGRFKAYFCQMKDLVNSIEIEIKLIFIIYIFLNLLLPWSPVTKELKFQGKWLFRQKRNGEFEHEQGQRAISWRKNGQAQRTEIKNREGSLKVTVPW